MKKFNLKKLQRSKLAMVSTLVTLLIILAGAIVIFLFVYSVGAKANTESAMQACRLSVISQANTKIELGLKRTSPLEIDCNKRYVNFYNTKVEIGIDPDNTKTVAVDYEDGQVKRFTELNDFIVNQVIAKEMQTCWYEFGEGKSHVFMNGEDNSWWNNANICYVCSEINFNRDTVKQEKFSGLIDYMKQTKLGAAQDTYYNYFNTKSLSENSWEKFNTEDLKKIGLFSMTFERDKSYLVFFVKDYHTYASDSYYVEVIPADKINTVCDYQAT